MRRLILSRARTDRAGPARRRRGELKTFSTIAISTRIPDFAAILSGHGDEALVHRSGPTSRLRKQDTLPPWMAAITGGRVLRHGSIANGHRGAKAQPIAAPSAVSL